MGHLLAEASEVLGQHIGSEEEFYGLFADDANYDQLKASAAQIFFVFTRRRERSLSRRRWARLCGCLIGM